MLSLFGDDWQKWQLPKSQLCASLKFLFEEAVFDFGVSGISNEMLDCPGFHTAKNAVAESTLTPRVRAGKPT